jgi:Na+/H+-dicarboxylate symporter
MVRPADRDSGGSAAASHRRCASFLQQLTRHEGCILFRLALHWQILIGMVAGAVIGLALSFTAGRKETVLESGLPDGIRRLEIIDTTSRTEIVRVNDDGSRREYVVDAAGGPAGVYATLGELEKEAPQVAAAYQRYGRTAAKRWGAWFKRIGGLFLRLLKMVAVPLIITSLISGIMGLGGAGSVGRMFSRTISYYLCTSMLAILTGLLAVNVVRPGLRGNLNVPQGKAEITEAKSLGEVLFDQLEALMPENPAAALVEPNFLSIIAFTLAVAIFALRVGGETAAALKQAAEVGFNIMMALTLAIIRLAPVGVFFLMMYVTATQGGAVFLSLAWYMLAVASALLLHALVTLPLILYFVAKRNPWEFAKAMSPALLTAFSSASSNGTLPLTMTSIERRAGVSNRTGSFVLPLGATINMDGTALYEAVAVLFIAQLVEGQNLALSSQLVVAFTALLASVGAAGIPHAGLVMMVIILQAVGLPVEMQGIILAVDRVLDMGRTAVNVWSDSCGCAVVDALEERADPIAEPAAA